MSAMQPHRIDQARAEENFPVASKLLPEPWRKPILDFYSFVRGMDDIADSTLFQREEKRDKLRRIRLAFQEKQPEMLPDWAQSCYRRSERCACFLL